MMGINEKLKIGPYGSWQSSIPTDWVIAAAKVPSEARIGDGSAYWLQLLPDESGRYAILKREANGRTSEVTAATHSARSLVHEYGGGSYLVHGTAVYYTNHADQCIYRVLAGRSPERLTRPGSARYADFAYDALRERLICVREVHDGAHEEPVNSIVTVSCRDGSKGHCEVLVAGANFYASPRIDARGLSLAWLEWNHPQMPWDSTRLTAGRINAHGRVSSKCLIAGRVTESILQPEWSATGDLYFISDRTGWWNLYRRSQNGEIQAVMPIRADCALPLFFLGASSYTLLADGTVVLTYFREGMSRIAVIRRDNSFDDIVTSYTWIESLRSSGTTAVFIGSTPTRLPEVVAFDVERSAIAVLHTSGDIVGNEADLSLGSAIEWGKMDGAAAHAFFYPPTNARFTAPIQEKPPLLVFVHGGPTWHVSNNLRPAIQYFTNRGLAVVDVNYGGSSGYGRAYRQRLNGTWGVIDVQDCANAAYFLIKNGNVDGTRIGIRGGSAGGFTTLSALVSSDLFTAGASHYGISDLLSFRRQTHKFESHYLDTLIGPLPEREDLYLQRSPIRQLDNLSSPLIVFQGLEDKVVPPNQSESIVTALRDRGHLVEYVPLPGEQHGFRRASSIRTALEAELYFYAKVFRFSLAEDLIPASIDKANAGQVSST